LFLRHISISMEHGKVHVSFFNSLFYLREAYFVLGVVVVIGFTTNYVISVYDH